MNNYYETCLQNILMLIKEHKCQQALDIIQEELKMPYVPEEFNNKLIQLKKDVSISMGTKPGKNILFDEFEILDALMGNVDQVMLGLDSLSKMNLRLIYPSITDWLQEKYLSDDIKKQLIVLLIEQGFSESVDVLMGDSKHTIDLEKIGNPFMSDAFQKCFKEIHDTLEVENPSMLALAIQLLEIEVWQDFPLINREYKAQEIISKVEEYMNADY